MLLQVLNYSTSIFTDIGLAESDAQYSTLGTTGAIVTMTVISVLFMDRIGRKPLHLGGLSGCLLSMILITVALFIQVITLARVLYTCGNPSLRTLFM